MEAAKASKDGTSEGYAEKERRILDMAALSLLAFIDLEIVAGNGGRIGRTVNSVTRIRKDTKVL